MGSYDRMISEDLSGRTVLPTLDAHRGYCVTSLVVALAAACSRKERSSLGHSYRQGIETVF